MCVQIEAGNTALEKRCKALSHLLGIGETEASDTSIAGRLSVIAKLKAAKRTEISRGQAGSWLYDVNRHLNICASLRKEYEALAEVIAEAPRERVRSAVGLTLVDLAKERERLRP